MNSIRHRTNDLFVVSNLLSCFSVYNVGRLVAEKNENLIEPYNILRNYAKTTLHMNLLLRVDTTLIYLRCRHRR